MKRRSLLTIVSLILALVFVISQAAMLSSCKNKNKGDDETSETTAPEENVLPEIDDGEEENLGIPLQYKNPDTDGKAIINANFCSNMEKKTSPIIYPVATSGVYMGFLWNGTQLVAIFDDLAAADKITVKVGSFEKEITDLSGKTSYTLDIPFADTGVVPQDLGQLIAFSTTVSKDGNDQTLEGFLQLCDYKVHFSGYANALSEFTNAKAGFAGSSQTPNTSAVGIVSEDGKLHIYDKYVSGVSASFSQVKLESKNLTGVSTVNNLILDVNLKIDAMPIDTPQFVAASSAYGLYFNFTKQNKDNSPFFTIINTEDGLAIVTYGTDAKTLQSVLIGKELGEEFHLSAVYDKDGVLSFAVDGYIVAFFEEVGAPRGFSSESLTVVLQRGSAAKSNNDNMDITIGSVHLTSDQSKSLTDNVKIQDLFGENAVVQMDGSEIYLAPESLVLDAEVVSRKYGLNAKANWFSSNSKVIGEDGTVVAPEKSGRFVTLTLLFLDGDNIVSKKSFSFFAKGLAPETNVLQVRGDSDPFRGKGTSGDTVFSLRACNSVIYDMGETTKVNRATVVSRSTSIGLISKNSIGLFYSNDNETYTLIENFSMLQTADTVYFYNFDVEARYLKVHYTNSLGEIGRITNSLQYLMSAGYSDKPLLATGDFENEKTVTVKNDTNEKVYDEVVSFTFAQIGISESDLKADKSDIRFVADGAYLPHYYSNGTFFVRVLEMDAKETLNVKVLYGNDNAKSVSDGNEVFEVQYGMKYAEGNLDAGWVNSVAEMPNGDLLKIIYKGVGDGIVKLHYYRSSNAGQTWTGPFTIENSGMINHGAAFIVDKENETVFLYGCNFTYGDDAKGLPAVCTYYIFKSTDNGYTWEDPITPVGNNIDPPLYAITYSDGIKLSTADGAGPEVDYVIGTGILSGTSVNSALNAGAIFSTDGGKTWKFSDTRIQYNHSGLAAVGMESGMSEEAIFERKDGTLMMYSRCQFNNITHFAISYSYDKGITWTTPEKDDLSNFYASNTQPIIEKLNGEPVLLWGGNNSVGGRSYYRVPLNMATTQNDGDTFTNLVDASFQTLIASFAKSPNTEYNRHVNPDLVFVDYYGEELCYITSTSHKLRIINVDDFLNKTKGGFDSFEDGYEVEGWITSYGKIADATKGATDGSKSMKVLEDTLAVRSLHYIEEGSVTFDMYVEEYGQGISIELQTAFNYNQNKTAPIKILSTPDGQLYVYLSMNGGAKKIDGAILAKGQNTITINFNGNEGKADLVLNGKTYDLTYISGIGNYISFATVFTSKGSSCYIDRFYAIKNK